MSELSPARARAVWVKSSYSNGGGGGCVEWAPALAASGTVPVRDSKVPDGPTLAFPGAGWAAFVTAVKGDRLPG
ncbi:MULTISPECIES: DUF397 domain-containing protein [unclassified Streptomyces]|uniref:DUF397 domain-containing protein n=1 Tax=unclassified Streptomyces TaxID=2593676 RepID=UPI0022B651B1|nr:MULTISPECIES: DUF397 domain-containing protein [unclassified Streptomyces]MCZ7417018.1 DUF397 domain-containing protein [Streptomyces sp. WMMC897]MCZ7433154.1 DUF397 domain-containing protein [Streptomyces sp. WMMC1477]